MPVRKIEHVFNARVRGNWTLSGRASVTGQGDWDTLTASKFKVFQALFQLVYAYKCVYVIWLRHMLFRGYCVESQFLLVLF